MTILIELFQYVTSTVIRFFPILLLGATLAAFIQVYVDPERMKDWLTRRSAISVPATVAFGAFTPFCACGTMAVIVGMLATTMPWAPIMAFLTSSPLMSPTNFVLLYGVVNPSFALATLTASVFIGLTAGYTSMLVERRSSFFAGQLRFSGDASSVECGCSGRTAEAGSEPKTPPSTPQSDSCCGGLPPTSAPSETGTTDSCGCGNAQTPSDCCTSGPATQPDSRCVSAALLPDAQDTRIQKARSMAKAVFQISVVKILPIFTLFTAVGFLVNVLVPSSMITAWLGNQSLVGVPLAALVGLPLYVSSESAVPLIRSLLDAGVSPGAMLAFMIAGPGTSAAAIAGIGTIMKKRAIALYVAYILGAALVFGYGYDFVLRLAAL